MEGPGHVKVQVEVGMRNPRIAGSLKELEKAGSPGAFGRSVVLPMPRFCTFGFQNCGRVNFSRFKVPSLW